MTTHCNTSLSGGPLQVSAAAIERILTVQIFSVVFAYPPPAGTLGSLPYIGPAFDTAREDIARLFPRLNISQDFLVSSPESRTCTEWARESDNALAARYYGKTESEKADVTLFLLPGCEDAGGVAQFATQLDKLIISRTFSLRTGDITIGESGERIPTMVVSQTDVDSEEMIIKLMQDPATGRLVLTKPISWPSGQWPVLNEPRCGFRGDAVACQKQPDFSMIYGPVLGTASCFVLVLAIVFRRRTSPTDMLERTSWWLLETDFMSWKTSQQTVDDDPAA
ncbi:hypothetical protein BV898_04567 [Hypsibius exemplaris]|uniref:Receptor ligand binding region domain-containing protein n=1 Tax=Hypsibius exemplaris TaxID=2072580 RepID=A0A1W0X1N0_HYPEX|nr:hypothetical protein BV898_04567 [Hypsibius exemplaris]